MTSPYLPTPADWHEETLEAGSQAIVTVASGGTPSTRNPAYWDGGVPWLTPKEVSRANGGIYVSRTERTISALGLEESGATLMPAGTVMLTKRAPVGVAVVNAVPMATNQGFLNFRCGPRLDPAYLCLWFRANRSYLDAVANGSTYPELYPGDLFEFRIALPSISEQRALVRFVGALDLAVSLGHAEESAEAGLLNLIEIHDESESLAQLRALLLPKLLAGTVRVALQS